MRQESARKIEYNFGNTYPAIALEGYDREQTERPNF